MNIRKRGNVWEYRFDISQNGKRKQISKSGFKTKKECEKEGFRSLSYYENGGIPTKLENITYSELLDLWVASSSGKWKPNTKSLYEKIIRLKIKPKLGSFRVRTLSPLKIQQFVNEIYETMSPQYAKLVRIVLMSSLKYAVVPLAVITSSPAEYVKAPRMPKQKTESETIPIDEVRRIVADLPEPYSAAVVISFYTGLRLGEVFALNWGDLLLNDKIIVVNKTMSYSSNLWRISTPKTSSSVRSVAIPDSLIKYLENYKKSQLKNRLKYGEFYIQNYIDNEILNFENGDPTDFILREENGSFAKPSKMQALCRKHGIKFHSLRHTHATALIASGVSPKIVQERLGHSNISITLQTYVHPDKNSHREAAETFERFALN